MRRTAYGAGWTILSHDPSERLLGLKKTDPEESEEEQISDTDNEFEYDDGGAMLPNFATYVKPDDDNTIGEASKASVHKALEDVTKKLKASTITSEEADKEDSIVREARKVARLQALEATEQALRNAAYVGAPIPEECLSVLRLLPEEEKQYVDLSLLKASPEVLDQEKPKKVLKTALEKYAIYKGELTKPAERRKLDAPYTYDSENKTDIELAKKLNTQITISDIDSSVEHLRCIRTVTRGKFFESLSGAEKPPSYLVCMDFSPESLYALEWCIGTVLQNNSVLFIVYVIEEEHKVEKSILEREQIRKEGIERLTKTYLNLLRLTRLQIHAVIEVIHHPIPRHLITEVIDHIQPNLVVVGSRGKHAVSGALFGLLLNYLVTKSTVPVMVVRRELKRTMKKKKLQNYLSGVQLLLNARVD